MVMETETTEARNKQTMQAAFEALNARDADRFKKLHADDVVVHHFMGPEARGVEAVTKQQLDNLDEMQVRELTPEQIIADGDLVAARWTADPIQDGKRIRLNLIGMFQFDNGKVKEVWLQGNPDQ